MRRGIIGPLRDFPWTVPTGHVILLLVPGFAGRRHELSPAGTRLVRAGAWLFATLAIWAALLRFPVYGACSLVLAVGLGRLIGAAVAALGLRPRRLRYVLGRSWACWVSWRPPRRAGTPSESTARWPDCRARPRARNVVLIVWDTVRAYSLGTYGYFRDTTPNLARWAREGVKYNHALAPAPWTYPSHSCFFTGQWPFRLNTQWNHARYPGPDAGRVPGLARLSDRRVFGEHQLLHLRDRAGPGLRPFRGLRADAASLLAHGPREMDPRRLLRLGRRFLRQEVGRPPIPRCERDQRGFLGWLGRRRSDRPFFAFLNYFDAHEPFVPPRRCRTASASGPRPAKDYQFLFDYVGSAKGRIAGTGPLDGPRLLRRLHRLPR